LNRRAALPIKERFTMSRLLKKRIAAKKARIAVVGLGYVGLPLAVSFAKKGFRVTGLDKDKDRVQRVQRRESYISDIPGKDLARVVRRGTLCATTDFACIAGMDVVIICVPTPIKRRYTPDISYILSAVRTVAQYLKKNTLIILESTTYPGTTKELIRPQLEKSGLKSEKDFFLSFSPERIDPGNKKYDVTAIPKVVGGLSGAGGELTRALYRSIIRHIHVVTSAEAAEMTKLLENSFRIINIGWINEVAIMAHKLGIDIWEVIAAAKTKPFGFMPFYPGLGVGGHCIPEDPLYLYWKAKQYGFSSKYIKLSADTNFHMASYVLERIRVLLRKKKKTFAKSRILVMGVTYKKDVRDLRKSPSLRLISLFKKQKAHVDYHDPFIPFLKIRDIDLTSVPLTPSRLKRYDCVVIAVDHTRVNYARLQKHARLIFDTRNVYGRKIYKNVVKF